MLTQQLKLRPALVSLGAGGLALAIDWLVGGRWPGPQEPLATPGPPPIQPAQGYAGPLTSYAADLGTHFIPADIPDDGGPPESTAFTSTHRIYYLAPQRLRFESWVQLAGPFAMGVL
jgi:hypothetical protein